MWTLYVRRMLLSTVLFGMIAFFTKAKAGDLKLYTPYTNISVTPGETITYSVDAINETAATQKLNLSLFGVPKSWGYTLEAGGYKLNQLTVLPGEKKTMQLKVDLPLNVNKGNYYLTLKGGENISLPLTINVSQKGSAQTEFTSKQANMEGHAKSSFTFNTDLKNRTAEKQLYSLRTQAPRGWNVIFKPNYTQANSVEVEANQTQSMNVEVTPPHTVTAGTYNITVSAVTANTSADLNLEVVITGKYEMELSTPTGLLNTSVTAGGEKHLELVVKNTGSVDLKNINMKASKPSGWDITFDTKEIEVIEAGKLTTVNATIKADNQAIAGDYVCQITANTPEVESQISLRVSVKTPMLWGWVGVLIIIAAIGSVFYMFRKYGRR